ncbi:MAG: D-amino acid aminotransferase [Burkholderiaceae bacterium]|nr:MAG: D-amino acid aminotransferase [Burkholderiaceae bacterium]
MQHTSPASCYLNGEFLPLNEAKISVLDRGFLFGDGIYDAVPVYQGRPFCWDEHMSRLERSLHAVRLANPLSREGWRHVAQELVERCLRATGQGDQLLYLQVTRGVAPRAHAMPQGVPPTVFAMSNPMEAPTLEMRHKGLSCVTARDFRWERGDIKSISMLGNVLARQLSVDQGAAETILLRAHEGGLWLTEGSHSNVWIVKDGALLGVPKNEHVLEGIRYELLRELCEEAGVAFNLRPISDSELRQADEVLLSSASKEVIAVTHIDGEPVGHGALRGKPGPVYQRLHEAYQLAKREHE